MTLRNHFETDGYVILSEVLGPAHCADLLREIIECFHSSEPTVIKNPNFRRHVPLPMSLAVSDALSLCVEHGHGVLSAFLKNEQELVELSSITVFPNAEEQPLHRDEANEGHYLASVFVNLADTHDETGALQLVPGSHHLDEGGTGSPIVIEVPQGSAVIMNSKLLHGGGANRSTDRIRSVFYFTMGERDLYGPPYSIASDVKAQRISLDELLPRTGQRRTGLEQESRPQLTSDCRLFLPLSGDSEELALARNGSISRLRDLEDTEEYLLEVMQRIECHPQELTVGDLANLCSTDEEILTRALSDLGRDGWICW